MAIHPQLERSVHRATPLASLTAASLPGRRIEFNAQVKASATEPDPTVTTDDRAIDRADGQPLGIRIYRNSKVDPTSATPAVVWFHGGAFVMGDLETEDAICREVCRRLGAVVVAADYRLAPEHPFPAGVEDCYRSLVWTTDHHDTLGIDLARIAIGGNSAGGGLTAAIALMARDRGGPQIAYQFLGIPMLDDRCDTASMRLHNDPRMWNATICRESWELYVGASTNELSPYAAPARATDLARLPRAYMLINELDPLADEDLAYAQRLSHAGVLTEIHMVPGAWHGFSAYLPWLGLAKRMTQRWIEAMAEAMDVELRA
jgi:acetyl esterase